MSVDARARVGYCTVQYYYSMASHSQRGLEQLLDALGVAAATPAREQRWLGPARLTQESPDALGHFLQRREQREGAVVLGQVDHL